MYIGIKNNKIIIYSEKPIDTSIYVLDEVRETEDRYMLSDDMTEYIPYNESTIGKREIQQELENKETQYGMNRWQREIILAEDSGASSYTKDKAQELEDLAEQLRND